ncbi:MAG: acyl-CoA thioester hydrolase/BAAT C-terminal domain-containing protein [Roseburia sp.]
MKKIVKISERNWDGILYMVDGYKYKVMIVMSGSEGGLEHAGKTARFLQDNGIPALAFGYFKTKHTEKYLNRIPLELIREAIDYLKELGYQKIGIEGISKGAEYALAASIHFSELSCVIVKTPSWFYSEGLRKGQPSGDCCWSYHGMSLPYTPYTIRHFKMMKMLWEAKEYNLLKLNESKKVSEESVIPVEKIKAPILMFSTVRDTVWSSVESCEKICDRLKEKQFVYPYKHVRFEHMSHMMLEYCGKEIKYFVKSEREDPDACYKERDIMGRECVKWIQNW